MDFHGIADDADRTRLPAENIELVYDEAKTAFRTAQKSPEGRKIAAQWLTYIEHEEGRLRALQSSLE